MFEVFDANQIKSVTETGLFRQQKVAIVNRAGIFLVELKTASWKIAGMGFNRFRVLCLDRWLQKY